MILKLNGIALDPQSPTGFIPKIWKGINDFSDNVIQGETDHIVNPVLTSIGHAFLHLNQEFITILPELAVLIAVIFVGIGMFTNFGKWLSRGVVVYLGGAVWIILTKAGG